MRIAICVKQVPATADVQIDRVTKRLKRENNAVEMNACDCYAMELALRLREKYGASVTARGGKFAYLRRGGLGVPRLGVAHRLHGDLRPAADRDAAHVYSLCVFSFHQPVTILIISLNITYTISASSNTIPAAWM